LSFLDIVVVFVFYNAVSGTSFEAKMHGRALTDGAAFLRLRGSGGYALCKRKRMSYHEWNDGRLTACVYTREGRAFDRLRIYAGSACYSCANCPQGVCVLYELRRVSYNT